MSWLTPLGLLGLLGILVLILIYILKPNYQLKTISSTFIWKLSMKYKRKKLPINLFRNIIILICQILIITMASIILTQPFVKADEIEIQLEQIAIIDASANMLSVYNDTTRYERAVEEVKKLGEQVIDNGGYFTIILADQNPKIITARTSSKDDLSKAIGSLTDISNCTYGIANVDKAMDLAEDILFANPTSKIKYYTATDYLSTGSVEVVDMSSMYDWNMAIVGTNVETVENNFVFTADVAVYNKDITKTAKQILVSFYVTGCNGEGGQTIFTVQANCEDNTPFPAVLDVGIYEYESVQISIAAIDGTVDTFAYDNTFFIYGGKKPTLDILYSSTKPNTFFNGILLGIQSQYDEEWNIKIKELNITRNDYILEGYDFYIFEHEMPETLPTDGVVFLVNPDKAIEDFDVTFTDREQA